MFASHKSPYVLRPWILRLFGLLHLVFIVWGLYFLFTVVPAHISHAQFAEFDPEVPYVEEAFYFRTAVNLILLALQAVAAFRLLRSRESGVRLTNVFCVALYCYDSFGTFFGFGKGISRSLGATGGIGNMGTAPQFLCGYPIIAFVALNLVALKGRPRQDQPLQRSIRAGVVIIALWALLLTALLVAGTAMTRETLSDMVPGSAFGLQLFAFASGAILAVVGIGLLYRREWARFTMVPVAAFLTWAGSSTAGFSSLTIPIIGTVFFLTFHTWMIWYLLRRWDLSVPLESSNLLNPKPQLTADMTGLGGKLG